MTSVESVGIQSRGFREIGHLGPEAELPARIDAPWSAAWDGVISAVVVRTRLEDGGSE